MGSADHPTGAINEALEIHGEFEEQQPKAGSKPG